ncbi:MAG: DNA-binding protein [Candidatus Njordarchaeia archaeon]
MAYEDEEDEEIRMLLEKRKAELAGALDKQKEMAQKEAELKARLEREYILRAILTEEARERLERIKLAKPHFAKAIEDQLILLAKTGRLVGQIDDDQLKRLLLEITKREGRRDGEIKIRRKSI